MESEQDTTNSRQETFNTRNGLHRIQQTIGFHCATDSLDINYLDFSAPTLDCRYDNGFASISAQTTIENDEDLYLAVSGKGQFSNVKKTESSVRCCESIFDSLFVGYGNHIQWITDKPMSVTFSSGSMSFHNATLRNEKALLTCDGMYDAPMFNDLEFTLTQFPIQSLQYYGDSSTMSGLSGIIRTMHLSVNGTKDSPIINMDNLEGDHITFKQTDFGMLIAAFHYNDKSASGIAHLTAQKDDTTNTVDTTHRVDIVVTKLPIDLAMHALEKRIPVGDEINANAHLASFPISFLELIQNSPVDQLRGFATGDMIINGTTPNFRYTGNRCGNRCKFSSYTNEYLLSRQRGYQVRN